MVTDADRERVRVFLNVARKSYGVLEAIGQKSRYVRETSIEVDNAIRSAASAIRVRTGFKRKDWYGVTVEDVALMLSVEREVAQIERVWSEWKDTPYVCSILDGIEKRLNRDLKSYLAKRKDPRAWPERQEFGLGW